MNTSDKEKRKGRERQSNRGPRNTAKEVRYYLINYIPSSLLVYIDPTRKYDYCGGAGHDTVQSSHHRKEPRPKALETLIDETKPPKIPNPPAREL